VVVVVVRIDGGDDGGVDGGVDGGDDDGSVDGGDLMVVMMVKI
jgi:hypothetical protein